MKRKHQYIIAFMAIVLLTVGVVIGVMKIGPTLSDCYPLCEEAALGFPTIQEVETDVSLMIDGIPEGEFKQEATQALQQFQSGQPVSRDFLLEVAFIAGIQVNKDIPTQELIDLLAEAYVEGSHK